MPNLYTVDDIEQRQHGHGQRDQAIRQWETALKITPNNREIIFSLAKVYNNIGWELYQNGNKQGAITVWKKAKKLYPRDTASKYYLKMVEK